MSLAVFLRFGDAAKVHRIKGDKIVSEFLQNPLNVFVESASTFTIVYDENKFKSRAPEQFQPAVDPKKLRQVWSGRAMLKGNFSLLALLLKSLATIHTLDVPALPLNNTEETLEKIMENLWIPFVCRESATKLRGYILKQCSASTQGRDVVQHLEASVGKMVTQMREVKRRNVAQQIKTSKSSMVIGDPSIWISIQDACSTKFVDALLESESASASEMIRNDVRSRILTISSEASGYGFIEVDLRSLYSAGFSHVHNVVSMTHRTPGSVKTVSSMAALPSDEWIQVSVLDESNGGEQTITLRISNQKKEMPDMSLSTGSQTVLSASDSLRVVFAGRHALLRDDVTKFAGTQDQQVEQYGEARAHYLLSASESCKSIL